MQSYQMVMVKVDALLHLRGCGAGLRGYSIIRTIYFYLVYDRQSMYMENISCAQIIKGQNCKIFFIIFGARPPFFRLGPPTNGSTLIITEGLKR